MRGIIVDVSVENAQQDQRSAGNVRRPSARRKRMPWVIALVLVLLACGVGSYLWYHNHQLGSAFAEQARAVAARDAVVRASRGLDDGCEETLPNNVQLCQEFKTATAQAQALSAASKDAGIDVIEDRRTSISSATEALEKARSALEDALLTALSEAYEQANTTLGNKIDELTALIAATEGKVADNQVRVDAQTAADTAKAVKEKVVKKAISTFREATKEHNERTTDVQAHIDALTTARDTYQQQQTQATSGTNNGGKVATRGSNNNRAVSGNNGYVAPRGNGSRTSGGYSGGYTAPAGGGVGAGGGTSSGGINSDTTPSRDWDAILKEHENNSPSMPCQAVGTCQ